MPLTGKIAPEAVDILKHLHDSGYEAYIVGGAVRDLLLGIEPKDYDIATSARPEQVRRIFGRSAQIIGRRFRLVHIYRGRHCFEVSTFRRKPSVEERQGRKDDDGIMLWRDNEYGSLEDDAMRRDFTINAMYFDAVGAAGIIDFTGGRADLEAGLIKSIGDPEERMLEDPVRMFRACGLAARYGLRLEPELAAVISRHAETIQLCSVARLFEELLKMFARAGALGTLEIAFRLGLLRYLWPALNYIWETPAGALFNQLLACREARIKAGGYSNSRALALATAAFPAILREISRELELNQNQGENEPNLELWPYGGGLERTCRNVLNDFFKPYMVPRVLSARARDIILMQPRFKENISVHKLAKYADYRYGFELFSLLTEVHGWDKGLLEDLPEPVPRKKKHAAAESEQRPSKRSRRRPRRRRNKADIE